jgi:hypothetical protein
MPARIAISKMKTPSLLPSWIKLRLPTIGKRHIGRKTPTAIKAAPTRAMLFGLFKLMLLVES